MVLWLLSFFQVDLKALVSGSGIEDSRVSVQKVLFAGSKLTERLWGSKGLFSGSWLESFCGCVDQGSAGFW